MFAARYGLSELEKFCRGGEAVLYLIKEKFLDPTCGLGYFLNESVPMNVLSEVMRDITLESIRGGSGGLQCGLSNCRKLKDSKVKNVILCDTCRQHYT